MLVLEPYAVIPSEAEESPRSERHAQRKSQRLFEQRSSRRIAPRISFASAQDKRLRTGYVLRSCRLDRIRSLPIHMHTGEISLFLKMRMVGNSAAFAQAGFGFR